MRFLFISSLFLALLLSGCVSMLAGRQSTLSVFAPQLHVTSDAAWPEVDWDLAITKPSATRMIDSTRILVRSTPNQLMVFHGIVWAQPPTELIQDSILQSFEDSGQIKGVARAGTGIGADFQLLMDIRRFEADYTHSLKPEVRVDLEVKLLDNRTQNIVAARTFSMTASVDGATSEAICIAFGHVLDQMNHAVVGWTLTTGQSAPRAPGTAPLPPTRREHRTSSLASPIGN